MRIDAKLCVKALRLNPVLWHATQLVAVTREAASYPIKSLDELIRQFDPGKGELVIEGLRVDVKQVRRYMPRIFFPILDEEDLLKKLAATLASAQRAHWLEEELMKYKSAVAAKGGA